MGGWGDVYYTQSLGLIIYGLAIQGLDVDLAPECHQRT